MFDLVPIKDISNSLEAKRVFRKINLEKLTTPLSIELMHYIEDLMQILPNPTKLEHNNILGDGVYLRELTVPKNTLLIGHTHKNSHLFVVLKGKAKIITPYENLIVKQGDIIKSRPFTKRIGITYEDSSFLNIYKNPENLTKEEDLLDMMIISREEISNVSLCSSSSNSSIGSLHLHSS
jgi:hypothetical protein